MATKYMHTVYGNPAAFDGDQIVTGFGPGGGKDRVIVLRDSRDEIKADQRASIAYRTRYGLSTNVAEYSWVRVEVPDA